MNGAIYVRLASVKDAQQIAALSAELGYPTSVKDTINYIQAIDKSICDMAYVAVAGDTVVGWIHVLYTIRLESGPFCEIGGLVVARTARNKGVGKLLVDKAKKWATERNMEKLLVRCNVLREGAHEFYAKSGFVEYKQQKVYEYMLATENVTENTVTEKSKIS